MGASRWARQCGTLLHLEVKALGSACNAGNAGDSGVQSLGQEDPLEKEMTSYSSILAWEIPWTEELQGCKEPSTV